MLDYEFFCFVFCIALQLIVQNLPINSHWLIWFHLWIKGYTNYKCYVFSQLAYTDSLQFEFFLSIILFWKKTFWQISLTTKLFAAYLLYYKTHYVYIFIYFFVSKAYSSYSTQCRKLKISMSNGKKIPQLVIYFMFL